MCRLPAPTPPRAGAGAGAGAGAAEAQFSRPLLIRAPEQTSATAPVRLTTGTKLLASHREVSRNQAVILSCDGREDGTRLLSETQAAALLRPHLGGGAMDQPPLEAVLTGRNGPGCVRTVANRASAALTGAVRTGLHTERHRATVE